METLSFEKNWANPKNDLVDPHRTKNGQNAPSCSVQWANPEKRSDLEEPILALPIHWIDIPEKLKKWHQEVEKVASGG